jgi:catechol 2,3-dioxygenase-like lactoylglutathione lyase family enzyme
MKLRHIQLPTAKLEEAARFYKLLGLREVLDQRPHHVLLSGDGNDGGTLSLLRFAVATQVVGGPVIYFECQNVDAMHQSAIEAGLVFAFAPLSKPSGRREAGLLDPDGRVVCIYHQETNKL